MISRLFSLKRRFLVAMLAGLVLLATAVAAVGASSPLRSLLAPVASPPTLVSYQGYVEVSSLAYTGTGYFKFAVMDAASGNGAANYWANDGTGSGEPSASVALTVDNGLFNVMLGDTSLAGMTQPITQNAFTQTTTYLRVWFSQTAVGPFQALDPNQPIGSAPYALRAERALTADVAIGIGDNTNVCTPALAGSLRWTGTAYEICDGSEWRSVTLGPRSSQNQIVLYHAGAQFIGALGGRGGAEALCANSTDRPPGYKNTRAFIGVSYNDEIRDMPTNYGVPIGLQVMSKTGSVVANNWSQLLSGNIIMPLQTAGVLPVSGTQYWWSGSYSDGSWNSFACNFWSVPSANGQVGNKTINNGSWMANINISCDYPSWLLCLAY